MLKYSIVRGLIGKAQLIYAREHREKLMQYQRENVGLNFLPTYGYVENKTKRLQRDVRSCQQVTSLL